MRVGCLVQRLMAATPIPKRAIPYQLGLKECRKVRLRAHLPEHPCGMHAVLGALNTAPCTIVSYCQMSRCHKVLSCLPQVLQRLWQTGLTTCLALPVCHPYMQHVLRSSALLEPDIEELHSSLSPLGLLKKPCQHTCLKHPYCTLGSHPSPKSWLSRYYVLKGMQECYPP